jgi:protein tyrosine/serine phosphatase
MMLQVSNKLYRGPRPKSHKELQDAGIKVVIDLESGFYETIYDDDYEKEDAAVFGIADYDIPCSDFTPPKVWQVKKVLQIIETSSGPVYIHCLHGKDRTGFVCAAYRMRIQCWSFKVAIKEMFDLGFHKWPYIWWLIDLSSFAQKRIG